jgi:Cytochrome P450
MSPRSYDISAQLLPVPIQSHHSDTAMLSRCYCCAGTDTLGGALAWILYELGAHSDVQQKLRDEIIAVMKGVCMYSYCILPLHV